MTADDIKTVPTAEVERILRPMHAFALETLGATGADVMDFQINGATVVSVRRYELEAVSRLYQHFNPSARYGRLLVEGKATEADRPPEKSAWSRFLESNGQRVAYWYSLGFIGGICFVGLFL